MQTFKRLHVAVLMGFIIISAAGVCAGELIRVAIWMNHPEWLMVVDQVGPYAVTGIALLGMLGAAVCTGRLNRLAYWKNKWEWSISIYQGNSPFDFGALRGTGSAPVITAKHVTDVTANSVADPFMIHDRGTWYLFYEVYNLQTKRGEIAVSTSHDLVTWTYGGIVLQERFHLSYPYVFRSNDDYYMIPESRKANGIRLYQAQHFPGQWSYVKTLLEGPYVDASLVQFAARWWLFVGEAPHNDTLRLFYSEDLLGPWVEHPKSPIVNGKPHIARPGGRVIVSGNRVVRYAQDDSPRYGNQVWAFEIVRLTETEYEEKQATDFPVIKATGGKAWNGDGMHNIDPHKTSDNTWVACVDGLRLSKVLRPGPWLTLFRN
jgi:Glycosyl hydrolases family 43